MLRLHLGVFCDTFILIVYINPDDIFGIGIFKFLTRRNYSSIKDKEPVSKAVYKNHIRNMFYIICDTEINVPHTVQNWDMMKYCFKYSAQFFHVKIISLSDLSLN